MDATEVDTGAARIAAAIGEPARARMLFHLLGGAARTASELGLVAEVSPSTASSHLGRLKREKLVREVVQGKHRYYSLNGEGVARVLEGLSVLAGAEGNTVPSRTPLELRAARTCYDHVAGALGVALHDRFFAIGWLCISSTRSDSYEVTEAGVHGFETLGIDVEEARGRRRRFACACLDWSERRPHLGGALGAAVLDHAVEQKWLAKARRSRMITVTSRGARALRAQLQINLV